MEYRICLSLTMDRRLAQMSLLSFLTIGNLSTSQALLNIHKVMAEQAGKMAKRLMKRAVKSNSDPYLALLDLRNTPTQSMGTSPAQRLLNRRTKTLLPTKDSILVPEVPDLKEQGRKLTKLKERHAHYYNRGSRDLKPLKNQDPVRIAHQCFDYVQWSAWGSTEIEIAGS